MQIHLCNINVKSVFWEGKMFKRKNLNKKKNKTDKGENKNDEHNCFCFVASYPMPMVNRKISRLIEKIWSLTLEKSSGMFVAVRHRTIFRAVFQIAKDYDK